VDNNFEVYLGSVFDLAETVVIKSDYSARIMNASLQLLFPGSFDPLDRRTWKYYLNLAGEYSPVDTVMSVTSIDTLETITFNKTNLLTHRATAREYRYGSKYYLELVSRYPDQEQLILGILYPVDLDAAIAAPDYTILGWPSHLVEQQEFSLMTRLQAWLFGVVNRWNNKNYRLLGPNDLPVVDELYEAAHIAMFTCRLPAAIMAIRLELTNTNQAHTYHIKQYLASNGYLDRYVDGLTLKQQLVLYRNIRWARHNAGRTETFQFLVKNTLTERRMPLTSIRMAHNTENQVEDLVPTVEFKRIQENEVMATNRSIRLSLDELALKQDPVAPGNESERLTGLEKERRLFTHSLSNVVQTKVLESSVFDYTDSGPYTLARILMSHWLYLSAKKRYNSFIRITNPATGEIIPLSVRDAFTFAIYMNTKMLGYELTEVPKVVATRVQRLPTVMPEELMKVSHPSLLGLDYATELLRYQPTIDPVVSIDAFYEKCVEIFRAVTWQRNLTAYQEHDVRRGISHGMMSRIYADVVCDLADVPGQLYADWFQEKSIAIADFPEDNYPELYISIVNACTGVDLTNTTSLKSVLTMMVQMLTELSSYSLQFISEINADKIQSAESATVRVGDLDGALSGDYEAEEATIGPFNVKGAMSHHATHNVNDAVRIENYRDTIKDAFVLELPDLIMDAGLMRKDVFLWDVSSCTVSYDSPSETRLAGNAPVLGIQSWLDMPVAERDEYANLPALT